MGLALYPEGGLERFDVQMGFSQRDMEFLGTLSWALSDIIRVYGVP